MTQKVAIGIDLGGTNIKAGLLSQDGRLVRKLSVPTGQDKSPEGVVARMVEAARDVATQAGVGRDDLVGAGIGAPGGLTHKTGVIHRPPNLPEWGDVPLRDMLAEQLEMPCTLDNDANAAAMGEHRGGAGRGVDDLVLLTLGTGIGGGIIVGGRLVRGHYDCAAEIGHMILFPGGRQCPCGQLGCFEAYASADSTARLAVEAIEAGEASSLKQLLEDGQTIGSREVQNAAEAGDGLAGRIWDQMCYYLAVGCVTIQHMTNPRRVLLGGGVVAAGEFLFEPVRRHLDRIKWHVTDDLPEIVPAALGNDAGIVGAAACLWAAKEAGEM